MTSVLVAYGSKHGSTAEIAETIASVLRSSGLAVDCSEAGDVIDLSGYDAVVLGSGIYMRRWRRSVRRFIRVHADELAARPFWVFSSGPVGDPANDNPAWFEPPRQIAEIERLGVRAHVVFGGRSDAPGIPEAFRDRRNWDQIRSWAASIAAALPVPAGT